MQKSADPGVMNADRATPIAIGNGSPAAKTFGAEPQIEDHAIEIAAARIVGAVIKMGGLAGQLTEQAIAIDAEKMDIGETEVQRCLERELGDVVAADTPGQIRFETITWMNDLPPKKPGDAHVLNRSAYFRMIREVGIQKQYDPRKNFLDFEQHTDRPSTVTELRIDNDVILRIAACGLRMLIKIIACKAIFSVQQTQVHLVERGAVTQYETAFPFPGVLELPICFQQRPQIAVNTTQIEHAVVGAVEKIIQHVFDIELFHPPSPL